MVVAFSLFNPEQWGFYSFLEWDKEKCFVPVVDEPGFPAPKINLRCEKEASSQYTFTMDKGLAGQQVEQSRILGPDFEGATDAKNTEVGCAKIELSKRVYFQFGVLGRGTALFNAIEPNATTAAPKKIIIKISSQAIKRIPERFYIRYARNGLRQKKPQYVDNLPLLIGWVEGPVLSEGPRGRMPGQGQIKRDDIQNRQVHVLVFPEYKHIYDSTLDEDRFKNAIRGCVGCKSILITWAKLYLT